MFMAAALLLCLFLIPCESVYSQGLPAQPNVSVKQAGLENSLAILFTGDLHSCVDKYPQLATFIKQEKLFFEKKGFTVIVVDAGDIAMG
jgi:2',3'-cyclic-nucleotide 2'-phosphodiesterase (5'-nucleotidase family)